MLYVERGGNNFASLQEVVPFILQKVADAVTLTDTQINVGETVALEVGHAEGTLLKGLVWSSSDEEVVSVDENGNVTGLKAGKAVVSVSNAAGVYAECTVTVAADEPADDISVALLEYAIELAGKVNMDGVVDAVKENFDNALQTAKDVLARVQSGDPTVTQNEVDSAWRNLIKAIQYGEFKAGDKTELEKVIVLAEQMYSQLDKYLEAGKAEFVAALDNAKAVYENEEATVKEVYDAYNRLQKAIFDLRLIPDKSLLEELLNKASEVDETLYTAESYAVLKAAMSNALAVFDDAEATEADVKAAEEKLENALDGLVLTDAGTETPENPTEPENPNTDDSIPYALPLALTLAAGAVFVLRKRVMR